MPINGGDATPRKQTTTLRLGDATPRKQTTTLRLGDATPRRPPFIHSIYQYRNVVAMPIPPPPPVPRAKGFEHIKSKVQHTK